MFNQLAVLGAHPELTGPALAAALDDALADAAHRRAWVEDPATGDRLAPWFGDEGWQAVRLGVMELHAPPPAVAAGVPVREAGEEAMRDIDLATYREDAEMPAGSVAAVAGANAAYRALPGTRSFIASRDGDDAAKATLYSDGRTAQIEDVATLVRHRGRGLAGAVVAHAAREALAGGHETVFLMCDLDGGPVALYERIGFRPAGHTWTFTRPG